MLSFRTDSFFLLSLRVRKIYAVCKGCRSVHRNVHTRKIVFHSHHSYFIQFRNLCVSQSYGYTHLSAGDLLREERAREESEFGQLIANYIKEGKIVPVEITINLLRKVCIEYRL